MKLSVIFVGTLQDGGFNQAALDGVERVRADGLADIAIVDGVPYEQPAMIAALEGAAAGSDGVVFIGGQGNVVTPQVAVRFPDTVFAVAQGNVTGPNLYSYDVLQEQSAFLAGALAARLTQTGVVGHLSGHRVAPGLKGRAAFVAGVRDTNPAVQILTGFCGTQDDSAVVRNWADALIAGGVDVMFTMLNGARQGAIDACRAGGIRQIGNARDWTQVYPDVFLASALARIDLGVERAVSDMRAGLRPGRVLEFGLAQGDYAGLSLAPDMPDMLCVQMDQVAERIRSGELQISDAYDGPEFQPESP